jgi:pyruvate/2-oxoglutarate dehydrogenase complex dihydrolipoamide acyltransferase (E2) component
LPFSLTYDHRVVNGVPAGRFLDDLADLLTTDAWISEGG